MLSDSKARIQGKRSLIFNKCHGLALGYLQKIVETIGKMRGITLKQLREKSKNMEIFTVRKLASLAAREFGYKGEEIAFCLQKDPSVITRYLKEGENFKADIERALYMLSDKSICNKQV